MIVFYRNALAAAGIPPHKNISDISSTGELGLTHLSEEWHNFTLNEARNMPQVVGMPSKEENTRFDLWLDTILERYYGVKRCYVFDDRKINEKDRS